MREKAGFWFDRHYAHLCVAIAVLGFGAAVLIVTMKKDDTDPPDGRSGMWLRTDAATGCEYLEGMRGGLIARVDAAGRHMGCR